MAANNIQFEQNISATVQDLKMQMGRMATTINELKQQKSGAIPSQAVIIQKGM